jgi:protein-disulfide isomerase
MATNRLPNESYWAAEAAECANDQGKFWEYHDKLFAEHRGEYVGTYTKANLKKYAADLKLDTALFNQCIDTDKTKSVIEQSINDAQRRGISGTPTFFINGRQVPISSADFAEIPRSLDSLLR